MNPADRYEMGSSGLYVRKEISEGSEEYLYFKIDSESGKYIELVGVHPKMETGQEDNEQEKKKIEEELVKSGLKVKITRTSVNPEDGINISIDINNDGYASYPESAGYKPFKKGHARINLPYGTEGIEVTHSNGRISIEKDGKEVGVVRYSPENNTFSFESTDSKYTFTGKENFDGQFVRFEIRRPKNLPDEFSILKLYIDSNNDIRSEVFGSRALSFKKVGKDLVAINTNGVEQALNHRNLDFDITSLRRGEYNKILTEIPDNLKGKYFYEDSSGNLRKLGGNPNYIYKIQTKEEHKGELAMLYPSHKNRLYILEAGKNPDLDLGDWESLTVSEAKKRGYEIPGSA